MITHFFTHKDFLPDTSLIPGTLYTPLQLSVEMVVLILIISAAVWTAKRKEMIKPVFTGLFISLVVLEVLIDIWDSVAGVQNAFDLSVSLPLYPCSIFMFVLPFIIWGKGTLKQMACGYTCTLGMIGAVINFLYPASRLRDYSCISFPAFHTFYYHGAMLFAVIVLFMSGTYSLRNIRSWKDLFLASVPGLVFSVPANIVNYSSISADYMYFTGQHELAALILGRYSTVITATIIMYLFYLFLPVILYLPIRGISCMKKRIITG